MKFKKPSEKTLKLARNVGLVAAGSVVGFGVAFATGIISLPNGVTINKVVKIFSNGSASSPNEQPSGDGTDDGFWGGWPSGSKPDVSSRIEQPNADADTDSVDEPEVVACPTGQIELSLVGTSSARAYWPREMHDLQIFTMGYPTFSVPLEIRISTTADVDFSGNISAQSSSANAIFDRLVATTYVSAINATVGKSKTIELGNNSISYSFAESKTGVVPGVSSWELVSHDISATWDDYSLSDCGDPRVVFVNTVAAGNDIIGGEGMTIPNRWWNY